MICKKCSAEYDDAYVFCPECGEQNENAVAEEIQEDVEDFQEYSGAISVYDSDESDEPEQSVNKNETTVSQNIYAEKKVREGTISRKRVASGYSAKRKAEIKAKKDKRTAIIAILLSAVGIISILLTAVRIRTDAFEAEEKTKKAVAISNLSAEDKAALEKELSECYSALKLDYDSEGCDTEDFISRVDPSDKGNFYSVINSVNEHPQTAADPAGRFEKEDGTYSYYKIEEAKIGKLLERFGLATDKAVNCKDYYYYDGFYYFNRTGMKATPTVSANITKSKRILDGGYYVECVFSVTDGSNTLKSGTYYIVAEKNEAADSVPFTIKQVDDEAIFSISGDLKQADGGVTYEMHEKIIEGKTDDGKLFCRYILKYPVFEESTMGETRINEFFSGTVSSYELKASSAQKSYDEFISKGGKAEDLPFTENISVRVTYSDTEKISFVEKISSDSPEIPANQQATTQEDEWGDYNGYGYQNDYAEADSVDIPSKAFEAYTFDRVTGDFVVKDDCVGKNYVVISEVLYRIYNSYDYQSVIPDDITDAENQEMTTEAEEPYEDNEYDEYDEYGEFGEDDYGLSGISGDGYPEDEDGLGNAIYESAGCFTEEGFSFFYVEEEGYVTVVTIPNETVNTLKELKSVTA